ncbi:MAG: RusA family crossover junction endodeoxyribonuclease [Peptostreptococcaceae bacterium]
MKFKNRKQKKNEYENKYSHIPRDFNERLNYMYDFYKINERKQQEIWDTRNAMMSSLFYHDIMIVLYEEPEGTPRARHRIINRKNFAQAAIGSPFVHVYSPNAKDDNVFMKKLLDDELVQLEQMIYTPCIVEYNTYQKTPSVFNTTDTFLAEIGLKRPTSKPDWDNIGKKYSDMSNQNIWLDDTLVITGIVNKYYSILPRVEIKIRYLNMLYGKYQYNATAKKMNDTNLNYFGGN